MSKVEMAVILAISVAVLGSAAYGQTLAVYYVRDGNTVEVSLDAFDTVSGSVAYQGPQLDAGSENWKDTHAYTGVSIAAIVNSLGGLADDDTLSVVAGDGWFKTLPAAVAAGESKAGAAILALSRDGEETPAWDDAPMLVFLSGDERFSNDDMLSAFGEDLSHYYSGTPSTTGMMVKDVVFLVVNYGGESLTLPPVEGGDSEASATTAPAGIMLSLVKGDTILTYTMEELRALESITADGTFTNSVGIDYTATYTGIPMTTLIGNTASDATILVTASDGYSMNYPAEMFLDQGEGTWVLAYMENGEYMPYDPGYLRVVQIGESNPHFTSSLSAKMVEQIEVLGAYVEYDLLVSGVVERLFSRGELEAGIGCSCHTATVSVTSKGETHTYTGIPLWRLVGYVDDDVYPAADDGIHYNDEDFDDALAETDYAVVLLADDGYEQIARSSWIAGDDRFIVAFKMDGDFLDPDASGYMRFVYDDSVELPGDASLKSVKFLDEIRVEIE